MPLRTGQQPLANRVREQAAAAFTAATGWRDLEARLAARGFRLEPAARGSGLLVTDGSRAASLSRIDRSLSGPRLAQQVPAPAGAAMGTTTAAAILVAVPPPAIY